MNIDEQIDPTALADGAGVPHGKLLVDFATTATTATRAGDDATALAAVREAVAEAMGSDALVDAAAVVANFTMMTRIADGTGTPLDEGSVDMSADIRAGLGVDDFVSKRLAG